MVGMGFGDALGVGTDYMSRREVESYYPEGLRRFDQIIRDAHRCQWKRGEYTNETTLTTLVLESILKTGEFVTREICRAFQEWYASEERDISPYMRLYCTNEDWLENPIPVAHKLWNESGLAEASNETLRRAVVTGLVSPDDKVSEYTRKFVLSTHDDSRCVATTLVMAKVIHATLRDRKADPDELMQFCSRIDHRTVPFLKYAVDGDIDAVKADDFDTMGWARKGMAVSLWGFWHHDNAPDTIYSVVDLGGDANTNAFLAGALAGLKYGYDALPAEKEKLIGHDYLMDLGDRLAGYIDRKVFA